MTYSKSSKNREGAFWIKRLPSFFLFFLLFLSSCKSVESPSAGNFNWGAKRGEKHMERLLKERKLFFAVVRDCRNEKGLILLAEKAASLLGVRLTVYRVEYNEIPPLLRSSRADFAGGVFANDDEVKALYLLPLEIKGKDETYVFALPRNGKLWKKMLHDALGAAAVR